MNKGELIEALKQYDDECMIKMEIEDPNESWIYYASPIEKVNVVECMDPNKKPVIVLEGIFRNKSWEKAMGFKMKPLTQCRVGELVRLVKINSPDRAIKKHLQELGFYKGAPIYIIETTPNIICRLFESTTCGIYTAWAQHILVV